MKTQWRKIYAFGIAGAFSWFGSSMTTFAVVLRDKDAVGEQGIAFYFMAFGVPSILFATLSGWVVDRFSTRAVIGPALGIMGLSSLSLTFGWPIWWTPVALLITAAAGTFVGPASQAAMITITNPDDLPRTQGLMQSFSSAGMLFAPVAAGFLIAGTGYLWPFMIDAISFWALGAVIFATGVNRKSVVHEQGEKISALEGIRFSMGNNLIRSSIVFVATLIVVVGVVNVGDVFLVQNELHASVWIYGIIGMTFSGGSILGALLVSAVKLDKKYNALGMLLGIVILIAGVIMFAIAWHWIVVEIVSIFMGIGNAILNSFGQAIVFNNAPTEALGRISAAVNAIFSSASVLGLVLAGPLLSIFKVRGAYLISAIVAVVVFVFFAPSVIRAGRVEHAEPVKLAEEA